ncbi:MAG: homoserine O-acetyltransferase [Clostridia bacterium]
MSQETTVTHQSAFRRLKRRPTMQYFTYSEPFRLESGATLPGFTLAYETYGTLSPRGDNVVLIPHALTGDSHCASHFPGDEPGWWEGFVGPGLAIDTEQYFVICSNVLGGCQGSTGPASIDPRTGKPYGMRFPMVTIGDMVRAQRELLRHLGIERLHAVVGGSMGGMQTLEWAVAFPEMVNAIAPIATPGRSSPQSIAFNEVGRQAIMADPNWRGGDYYDGEGPDRGLALARMIGMITYQSDESMWRKFGRELMNASVDEIYSFSTQFQVESYLHYQGKKLVERFDANSYLYLTRALDLFDLGRGRGGLRKALSRIRVPTMVVGISSDILYPTYQQKELVSILREHGVEAWYEEIDCPYGHDGFLIEAAQMTEILRDFFQRIPR